MRNKLKWCICLIVFTISCKDKPEPKPMGNPDDLIGKWASTDSILFQRSGNYVYIKDTLTFSKDATNHLGTFPYFMTITGYESAFFSYEYFTIDSVSFKYLGPTKMGFIINNFKNKVTFNNEKDTLTLDDFRRTYPYSHFYKFYKIK